MMVTMASNDGEGGGDAVLQWSTVVCATPRLNHFSMNPIGYDCMMVSHWNGIWTIDIITLFTLATSRSRHFIDPLIA